MRRTELPCSCRCLALLVILLGLSIGTCLAQDILTKGAISGTVVDASGAVIPGALVGVSGDIDKKTTVTDGTGAFAISNLLPGIYTVKAEAHGFKTATVNNIAVYVGKSSAIRLAMQVGDVTEVIEVTTGVDALDLSSTAVSANLSTRLFENLPLQRSVTSLFYMAPGATDGIITAAPGTVNPTVNPSISGGSALDNLYVADGVNVTDSAFGGFGTFSRVYGSLGVGITSAFVQEVQVKTGAFEPQYGQAEGGVVNIITKSGGDQYHGEVWGYAQPQAFEGTRFQRDDYAVNKVGEILHPENYDAGFDVGGAIPATAKHLFFFGSYNPSITRTIVEGAVGSGLRTQLGETARRSLSNTYAAKIDANISPKHQFNFSVFGDPTKSNTAPWSSLNIDNTTANSVLDYGTRSVAVRYTGTLSQTWTLNGSYSWGHNDFNETGFANFNQIVDRTQATRGNFTAIGLGFIEPTTNDTYRTEWNTQKIVSNFLGSHSISLGYSYQRAYYSGTRDRSGPHYTVPSTNADGTYNLAKGSTAIAVGQPLNASWSLRLGGASCTLCPLLNVPGLGLQTVYLRQDRGEFGVPQFDTRSNYHAAYLQDSWRINKYVTFMAGYRWEMEQMIGSPDPSGFRNHYAFTDNWSPRFGATVDPFGQGKTKVFYNFSRFTEYFPLDAAERSLSSELDFTGGRFAPAYSIINGQRIATVNQYGTVTPVVDAAHLLSKAVGGTGSSIAVSSEAPNPILAGTKLGFAQEHTFGFEQQLPHNFVISVRYHDRRLKRIIEDASVEPPEDAASWGTGAFGQTYFLGNISSKTDAGVNPIEFTYPYVPGQALTVGMPAKCDPSLAATAYDRNNNPLGNFCFAANGVNGKPAGNPGADGVPDGFVDPVHVYKAVEIEVNKRFGSNWQMLANWRIGSLRGNYEGAYRNDNGQTDPGISSLFDFTPGDFNLLGDQFAVGPLNTDRRNVVNIFNNYALTKEVLPDQVKFLNGLNIGTAFHIASGLPMSNLAAHPVYLNAGEVPLGGRGSLGRTPTYVGLDVHADYSIKATERMKIALVGDVFNVTNNKSLRLINQLSESTYQQPNPDFKQPIGWTNPVSLRMGLKLTF